MHRNIKNILKAFKPRIYHHITKNLKEESQELIEFYNDKNPTLSKFEEFFKIERFRSIL